MKTKLVIVGAAGRMGRRIVALAVEAGQFDIIGAVERPGHRDIGKDAGILAGAGTIDVKLTDSFPKGGEVVISHGSSPGSPLFPVTARTMVPCSVGGGTLGAPCEARGPLASLREAAHGWDGDQGNYTIGGEEGQPGNPRCGWAGPLAARKLEATLNYRSAYREFRRIGDRQPIR